MADDFDFSAVRDSALSSARTVLDRWLPGGKYKGHEYVVKNPTRADNKAGSFSINTTTGEWADFATGDKGGDLISLVAYLENVDQLQAGKNLAELLSISQPTPKNLVKNNDPTIVLPVPPDAPSVDLGEPSLKSAYKDKDGNLMMIYCRYDVEGQRKSFKPFTLWRRHTGELFWQAKAMPKPFPLYNLDILAKHPKAKAVICEGEKAAKAASKLYPTPDYVATTWPFGAQNFNNTDLTPLHGRDIILWPDNDDAGIKAMQALATMLEPNVNHISTMDLDSLAKEVGDIELAEKYDAADAVADGLNPERMRNCTFADFCPTEPIEEGEPTSVTQVERALLAQCMRTEANYLEATKTLVPADFSQGIHQVVFKRIGDYCKNSDSFDEAELSMYMCRFADLPKGYIAELQQARGFEHKMLSYIEDVKDQSDINKINAVMNDYREMLRDPKGKAPRDIIDKLQNEVFELSRSKVSKNEPIGWYDLFGRMINNMIETRDNKKIVGHLTNISPLDRLLSGYRLGSLNIIAARPGAGKTSFALNLVASMAMDADTTIDFFCFEMLPDDLMMRYGSIISDMKISRIEHGLATDDEICRAFNEPEMKMAGQSGSRKAQVLFHPDQRMTVGQLRTAIRRNMMRRKTDVVVVDYIQQIVGDNAKASLYERVTDITRELKCMAMELNVAIVALCQMNRDYEKRLDKEPKLSDLRDSGSIEQDADTVMFISRDEKIGPLSTKFTLAKNRRGPTGEFYMNFQGDHTRFVEDEVINKGLNNG